MNKEFQGSWVVVTGGSRGIGFATSLYFAERGANIVIIYLEQHEEVQAEYREEIHVAHTKLLAHLEHHY